MVSHVKVSTCIQNIHVALAKHDEYKTNYQMLFTLPLVNKLRNRNRQLKKQVRTLKNMLMKTRKGNKEVIDLKETEEEGDDDNVVIVKIEKESEKEMIVYEIEEEDGTDEPEAFAEEIQAQEEGEADEEVVEEEVEIEEEVVEEEEEVEVVEEEEEEVVVEEEEEVEVVEEEVEEEVEEVVEVEEEVEEVVVEEEEEEEVEYEEVVIKGVTYCTNDAQNGQIYAVTEDGELGDMVGNFVKGKAVFLRAQKKA